jgi:putative tricarboxylic transport membrane protein
MILFGFVGLIMKENGYAIIPLILGVILGPIIEGSFLRSMLISGGDYSYFFDSSIALVLWILIPLVLLAQPAIKLFNNRIRPRLN